MTALTELSIEFTELPPSPNRTRESHHWAARASLDQRWRMMSKLLALDEANRANRALRQSLPWTGVGLSITFYLPDRRRRDPGNLVGSEAVKALVDGLVDAGWIADDSINEILVYGPFVFEYRKGKPGCRVTVKTV